MDEYIDGEVYFRVSYPDAGLKYPQIDSFVFIGKNLSAEDENNTWYFQWLDSYAKFGSVLNTDLGNRKVSILEENDLDEMMTLEKLYKNLQEAERRRQS